MTNRLDTFLGGMRRLATRAAAWRAEAEAEPPPHEPPRHAPGGVTGDAAAQAEELRVPAPPGYAPAVAPRPEPAAAVPWGVRVAAEAGWRLLVLAGVVFVLMRILSSLSLVIVALSAGLLITALLEPTTRGLRKWGLGRGSSTALAFVGGFVVMGLVGWFVVWQVVENLDTLTDKIQAGIEELKSWALEGPFHVSEDQINDIASNLSDWVGDNTNELTSAGLEGVGYLVEFLSGTFLTMFVTLFLLYDGKKIWTWALKFVPAAAREGVAGAGPRAWRTLTGYVRGTVIVALIDAVFIGIGIYILDVPMAVPLGVFIFLFAFVPIIGAVVSGALAVVVALVTNGLFTALLVLGVVLLVQQIESHVLQPFILGRLVQVHPLAVVLSVTGGSLIAGIPGAVVAVPLVAVTNTAVGYLKAYAEEQALRRTQAVSASGGGAARGDVGERAGPTAPGGPSGAAGPGGPGGERPTAARRESPDDGAGAGQQSTDRGARGDEPSPGRGEPSD